MPNGDFLPGGPILYMFEAVEMSSGFLLALEVEEILKSAVWLQTG